MYHDIPETARQSSDVTRPNFNSQLDFLEQNGYTTVTINDYVDVIKGIKRAAPKSILITFDDGYESAFTVAKPALEQRNMKAVFFVVTGFTAHSRAGTASGLPHMNVNQLRELDDHVLFDVHNHSKFHSSLTKDFKEFPANTRDLELNKEISDAKASLEADLGGSRTIMAFPFGDYDASILALIKKIGFTMAFSVDERGDFGFDPALSIPRIGVGSSVKTIAEFKKRGAF